MILKSPPPTAIPSTASPNEQTPFNWKLVVGIVVPVVAFAVLSAVVWKLVKKYTDSDNSARSGRATAPVGDIIAPIIVEAEHSENNDDVCPNSHPAQSELGKKLLPAYNIDDIGRAHPGEECWNILKNGTPYYLLRFLFQHLLGLHRDGIFPAVVGMCVLQFYLASERRYTLLGPIACRFITNLVKHAYAVIQHKRANRSIRNRRAHLMSSTSQGDLWADVPFESILPGNILKVSAEEYVPADMILLCALKQSPKDSTDYERADLIEVDTSHVNGEPDPCPRSAVIRHEHIDGPFNERNLERYLLRNVRAGCVKDFQRSVDFSIVQGVLQDTYEKNIPLVDDCLIMRECKVEKTVSFIVGVAVAANADSSSKSTKLLEKHKFLSIKTSSGRLALAANSFFLLWLMMTCTSTLLLASTAMRHRLIQHW